MSTGSLSIVVASRTAIATAASSNAGNGNIVFGFVGSSDPGLPVNEYVVVPFGSQKAAFSTRAASVGDANYHEKFLACLYSDAETVHNKVIPANLKGWAAANRAHQYAAGYLGHEHVVQSAADTTATQDAKVAMFPHLADAVSYDLSVGTLAIFFCTLNYWNSNHNTTGSRLPKGQMKIVRTIMPASRTDSPEHITDATYFAGHSSDKRLTLRCILDKTMVGHLEQTQVFNPVYLATGDAWAAMRTGPNLMPAGTAIIGILKIFLNEVKKNGLMGFSPAPQAVTALKAGMKQVKDDPTAFHPGAKFLFDANPVAVANVEDLKTYVGIFGSFCREAGYAISTTSAPHISELIDNRADSTWTNIGKFFAKGVEISEEKVKSATSTYGVSTGANIPDPVTDADGYKVAVDAIGAEFDDITFA